MNYAWFSNFDENSDWTFLNSLSDLRVGGGVRFQWGNLTTGEDTVISVVPFNIGPVLEVINQWVHTLPGGNVAVFGRKNLFEPLLHHYQRWYGVHPVLGLEDILESFILPGAVPTLDDRRTFGQAEAEWFTACPTPQPIEFFRSIIARR